MDASIVKDTTEYDVTLKPSRFYAQWRITARGNRSVLINLKNIHDGLELGEDIPLITISMIVFGLTEQICLERYKQGCRISNRCDPCACEEVAMIMLKHVV